MGLTRENPHGKTFELHNLIVNVDSSDVVNLISSAASTNRLTQPLVVECRNTLQAFHQVWLNHCFKEANQAVDSLARMGSSRQEAFVYYITPPMFMLDILSFDNTNSSASNVNAMTETFVVTETCSFSSKEQIELLSTFQVVHDSKSRAL
ncbi:hypothetical protein SO802_014506 [Lithocarpus litseifolius]|uniref:RNase H type-1 domain-containing protein n=1 Tax=Lithocarpus litseifolius TaxID=425828 RepID=A0AAW2CU70_9ROSI